MTPRLIAYYVELTNHYLDRIPIENTNDFETLTGALKSILESQQPHTLPASLEGRISYIKALVDHPEMHVQNEQNYKEFKDIVLKRVAAKIKEFSQLTPQEKEQYIANQDNIRNQTPQNHREMAPYQLIPTAPTITDEDLLELQRQYQGVGSNAPNSTSNYSIQEPQSPLIIAQMGAQQDRSSIQLLSNYRSDNYSLIEIARKAAQQTGETPREDKPETSSQQVSLIQRVRNFSKSKVKATSSFIF